jgi:hypothetical protein
LHSFRNSIGETSSTLFDIEERIYLVGKENIRWPYSIGLGPFNQLPNAY